MDKQNFRPARSGSTVPFIRYVNIICPTTDDKLSSVVPPLRLETPSETSFLEQW